MSMKEMPNRFGHIPPGQVLAWLNHPATAVLLGEVKAEESKALDGVLNAAGTLEAGNAAPIAGQHARYVAMGYVVHIVEEARSHVGL